jgi:hypothetical protein
MGSRLRIRATATAGLAASVALLLGGFALVRTSARRPDLELELAIYMGELQHHTHKLDLAIQSENPALADFYLHEVEEVAEQIERLFPQHEGHRVGDLARAILEPQLVALRTTLERSNWAESRTGFSSLIAGCNQCHSATSHEFIRIEATTANPFNQSFAR